MKPLFHISFNQALPSYLYPRQPSGLFNPDDIEAAIFDSIKLSKDSFEGKAKLLEMKGE